MSCSYQDLTEPNRRPEFSKWNGFHQEQTQSNSLASAALTELRSYCQSSTIHGPSYFMGNKDIYSAVWLLATGVCLYLSLSLIADSFHDWARGNVLTTIADDSVPVHDIQVRELLLIVSIQNPSLSV